MSAQIVDLAQVRAARAQMAAPLAAAVFPEPDAVATKAPFQFWSGASGARYVHSIYNLFECPPIEAANYILVKRHLDGRRTVLSIGRASNTCASLNLADVRQRCAHLGANEIHIHLLAEGNVESQDIEADLRRSLVIA